jgi:hypothetical protein
MILVLCDPLSRWDGYGMRTDNPGSLFFSTSFLDKHHPAMTSHAPVADSINNLGQNIEAPSRLRQVRKEVGMGTGGPSAPAIDLKTPGTSGRTGWGPLSIVNLPENSD